LSATIEGWRAAGATFEHRGHRVFHRLRRAAPPEPCLLLIHGFPTASWDWHRVWDGLGARFGTVVAADMIGFGFSAKPRDHDYSVASQADLQEALLARLGITRVHVLAHDYGDTVAQELLARHEERAVRGGPGPALESLCFLNGGLFPEAHRATRAQRLMAGPLGPLLARAFTRRAFGRALGAVFGPHTRPSDAEMDDLWRLVTEERGVLLAPRLLGYIAERRRLRERWVGALQRTAVPRRLVVGPEDPVSGRSLIARYRELVPAADVVVLDGIGHYPQLEAPAAVVAAAGALWDRLTAR
jgi:pimeloyl-ACP methyl ester carboxylesterase